MSMNQHNNVVLSACFLFCGLSFDFSKWMEWVLYRKRQDKVVFQIVEFKMFTSCCATDESSILPNFKPMFPFYIKIPCLYPLKTSKNKRFVAGK